MIKHIDTLINGPTLQGGSSNYKYTGGDPGINITVSNENITALLEQLKQYIALQNPVNTTMTNIKASIPTSAEITQTHSGLIDKIMDKFETSIKKNMGYLIDKNDVDASIKKFMKPSDIKSLVTGRGGGKRKSYKGGDILDTFLPPGLSELKPILQCLIKDVIDSLMKPIDEKIQNIFQQKEIKDEFSKIVAGLVKPPSKSFFSGWFGGNKSHKWSTRKQYKKQKVSRKASRK